MRKTNQKPVWIYGTHAVGAVLQNPDRVVLRIIVASREQVDDFGKGFSKKVEIVDKQVFASLFGKDAIHQWCAVLVEPRKDVFLEDILRDETPRPIVVLDQVTDPHNVGAILRSAAAFDAKCLIVTENHSPSETSVLSKTASGALEIVPIVRVVNLYQCLQTLKKHDYWCVGLDERGTRYVNELDLCGKYAFIIGSEGKGMRRLTKESCDILSKLPVSAKFTTLNAAQACTVTLYESMRQRCISKR